MVQPAPLKDASTVLLLRPAESYEIFMVRRHSKSAFLGNMYVFPGGKRDDADSTLEVESFCHGLTAADCAGRLGDDLTPARALGLYVAAIRETFEEAGVLLAVDGHGQRVDATQLGSDLVDIREQVHKGTLSMASLMERTGWRMNLGAMHYLDHWVTPPIERRRFTARFFLAEVAGGTEAAHDEHETTDGVWLTPGAALAAYADPTHKLQMAPPTIRVLELLADCPSMEDALASAPDAPVLAKAPQVVSEDGKMALVLPGDPLHPTEPGARKQRFYLEAGRWLSVFE